MMQGPGNGSGTSARQPKQKRLDLIEAIEIAPGENEATLWLDESDENVWPCKTDLNEPNFIEYMEEIDDFLRAETIEKEISSDNCNSDGKCLIWEHIGDVNSIYNNQDMSEDETEVTPSPEPKNIGQRKSRTSKCEIRKMSKKQKLERKKIEARNSTNRCYAKKKSKLKEISENLWKLRENVDEKENEIKNIEMNLNNSLIMILERGVRNEMKEVSRDLDTYKMDYEQYLENIREDENVIELEKEMTNAEIVFFIAEADLELKRKNQNTYGSIKCRAKTKKEQAQNLWSLNKAELEFEAICKYLENLEIVKNQVFPNFLEVRNTMKLNEMYNLEPEIREIFEDLLTFYNLPNPV